MDDEIRKLQMQINDLQSRLANMQTIRDTWSPTGGWTYASASTVKEPGDVTALYPTGTKVRWYQSAWKYGYIVGSSYSSPHTTLTIAGNAVSNAAVVTPAFSYASNPPGFPGRFSWIPTSGASGDMTFTSITINYAYYAIIGNIVVFGVSATGTTGGTASNTLTLTVPININISSDVWAVSAAVTFSGGSLSAGVGYINTAQVISVRRYDAANYSLGAGTSIRASGLYTI